MKIDLPEKRYYTIGEVAKAFNVNTSLLRFWEKEFKEIDKGIKKDIDNGLALNPADMNTLDMMNQQNTAFAPEIRQAEAEASAERDAEAQAAQPKPSSDK